MRYGFTVRWPIRVTLAALALAGGIALGAGDAEAAKTDRKNQTSARTKLTVLGSTTQHDSCEGQLAVSVAFTRKGKQGDRTVTRAVTVGDDGTWETTLDHARATTYRVSATLVGHRSGALTWAPSTAETRRGKTVRLEMGTLRIAECGG